MLIATGGAAAAAAAAAALLAQQEEEEMTSYTPKDLAEEWEFKIIRANTRVFGNPLKMRAILDEERRGGWVLVEKFDDTRIRLKRPAGTKVVEEDLASGYDPYRTTLPLSQNQVVGIVAVIASLSLMLIGIFLAALLVR